MKTSRRTLFTSSLLWAVFPTSRSKTKSHERERERVFFLYITLMKYEDDEYKQI